jgi:hypothetical protein
MNNRNIYADFLKNSAMHNTDFTATAAITIPCFACELACWLMAKGRIGGIALNSFKTGADIITKLAKPARSSILPLSPC